MRDNRVETVIIGGGQAGLSTSYYLSQGEREHVVLEKSDLPGNVWRNDRWDSFTLNSPNWTFRLPGAAYQENDPDGFMRKGEVVERFVKYVERFSLPVVYQQPVVSVEKTNKGYAVTTTTGLWLADHVVVATGLYQKPKVPDFSPSIPDGVLQIPAGKYRNPDQLPPGAVLVVGSGQTGCQIAEELYQSGRKVYLSVGSAGRAPRRYRGRDIFSWLNDAGFFSRTTDKLPNPQVRLAANPQLSGNSGGHNLNLHQFSRDGVTLLGKLSWYQEGCLQFAGDLRNNLMKSDQVETMIIQLIDQYIAHNGIEAPEETLPTLTDGFNAPEIGQLSIHDEKIKTIIWAAGYSFDFSMVRLPIFDPFGFPTAASYTNSHKGIYFVGIPWVPYPKTGLLLGVDESAAAAAEHILDSTRA